jgi:hypothetical protein
MTGRLRTKWVGIRTDEVFFRDTAHGFLAWAAATAVMAALFTIGSLSAAAVGAATGAENVTAEAAERAREAAATASFFTALSLLIGAFIASAAGAYGGYHRDAA